MTTPKVLADRAVHKQFNLPLVKGLCPACGSSSLFLGAGGYVTCGYLPCPDPTAASDLLERRAVT